MLELALAMTAFVAGHELLSHPLRAPLVARLGRGGFAAVYSLIAAATLYWTVSAWKRAPVHQLWIAPEWLWGIGSVLMLAASILLVGSVTSPNPALMGGDAAVASAPRGVLRITRHPMMWAFALWALVHAALAGSAATLLLAGGIGFLALFGAHMQDGKKRDQLGAGWAAHEAATSYLPFGTQLSGRASWRTVNPGAVALLGGVALWLVASWAHPHLGAPVVGVWRAMT